jgi:hypothetical protein
MAKLNKIVTSQIEGSTGARHETNTYSYDSDGILVRHNIDNVGQPVIGPGVVYGANGDSADESGLNTIKLVPNEELVSTTNQYLVIEPTLPNHIHIRAGGTQDDSNATLYFGAERNSVLVSDQSRSVEITTRPPTTTQSLTNVQTEDSAQFVTAVPDGGVLVDLGWKVLNAGTEYTVTSLSANTPSEGFVTITATGLTFGQGAEYTFYTEETYNNTWIFTNQGYISGPAMGGIFVTGVINNQSDLYLQSTNDVNVSSGNNHDIHLSTGTGGKIFLEPAADHVYVGTESPTNRVAQVGDLAYIRTAVPTSSIGVEGHVEGMVADDGNFHYYCSADYDGTNHVWKRVGWTAGTWGV